MNKYYKQFLKESDKVANDLKHRKTIQFNMSKYDAAVGNGKKRFKNIEKAKAFVAFKKRKTLTNLDTYLLQFEAAASARGVEVIWAENAQMAGEYIKKIIAENNCKLIVKSKSMTSEEIEFNHEVENIGVESVETDLGEYIVQIAGEKP